MNALFAPGAKRTRILVAFGLTLLLAAPAALIWANRSLTISNGDDEQSKMLAAQDREENTRLAAMGQLTPFYPPAEFSPLAITKSNACCSRSFGRISLTARRPGCPTISPMKSSFTPRD